jgi:hypothetical protein
VLAPCGGAYRFVILRPTLRAGEIADYRWLTVHCPGCGTVKDIDSKRAFKAWR